jgi:hypothetical protein
LRTILLIGVLAALCFSVGDGLRLLPLPYTPSDGDALADSRPGLSSTDSAQQSQFRPGSLALPPQAQKTLKFKQTHHVPSSGCALPPPHNVLRRAGAQWRAGRDLNASVTESAGRAPPRTA